MLTRRDALKLVMAGIIAADADAAGFAGAAPVAVDAEPTTAANLGDVKREIDSGQVLMTLVSNGVEHNVAGPVEVLHDSTHGITMALTPRAGSLPAGIGVLILLVGEDAPAV